jgi:hypothetical protein
LVPPGPEVLSVEPSSGNRVLRTEFRKAWCHLIPMFSPWNRVLRTEFRKAWCHLLLRCSPWNRILKTEFRKAWCHLLLRCSLKTELRKAWCHRVSMCHWVPPGTSVPPGATGCHLVRPVKPLKTKFRKACAGPEVLSVEPSSQDRVSDGLVPPGPEVLPVEPKF